MAVPSETTDLKEVYSVGGHVRAKILGIAGSNIGDRPTSLLANECSSLGAPVTTARQEGHSNLK